ncbi:MAG: hypothetical protein Q8J63_04185 [Candidatus Aquicultor sp.]|nr:hypothetical protein [Candidatus Aquicultor sp.]
MSQEQGVNSTVPEIKPWYKKWWGILLIILFWPIAAIWAIWVKTKWSTVVRIVATAGVVMVIIAVGSDNDSSTTKSETERQIVAASEERANKPVSTKEPIVVANPQKEAKPKPTSTTTEALKVVEPKLINLSAKGQQASSKFNLSEGLSVFSMTHKGTSNFAITLLDQNGQHVELLVNVIGSFDGSKAVGIANAGTYVLDVSADGPWSVSIKQPRPTTAPSTTGFRGTSQQATQLFWLDSGLKTFKMQHTGDSNFAPVLLDEHGNQVELLANEIGKFNGSKAVGVSESGLYILDVTANKNWSIVIE